MLFNNRGDEGRREISKQIVVLTPMRDEGWCAEAFFSTCSLWADHILVSDQSETKVVASLAEKYPKVEIFRNATRNYNELENRNNLLREGRARFGESVFISLDADERLTANILDPEIQFKIRTLPGGTALSIPFANLTPEQTFWEVALDPIGFSDDGRVAKVSDSIHFPRTCISEFDQSVDLGLKILHLQYLDQKRFKSKVDWYKLLEVTNLGARCPVATYRRYSHFQAIRSSDLKPLRPEMVEGYLKEGVDPLLIRREADYWWESDVAAMLKQIVDRDRSILCLSMDDELDSKASLTKIDRFALWYLKASTRLYRPKPINLPFVILWSLDWILSLFVKNFEKRPEEMILKRTP